MKQPTVDWPKAVGPLIKKYQGEKHPLHADNIYEEMVMVVLSAQTTDNLVNIIAPDLFKAFPTMQRLSKATADQIIPLITKIRNHRNKANWLIQIATQLKNDEAIPLGMDALVELPGIGRKSANVIKRFAGAEMEGIMVDLHTVRVANRLGIVTTDDPKQIEVQMMEVLPKKEWDAGMCMSFLGRHVCRPKPECPKCVMKKVCAYYREVYKKNEIV